MNPQNIDPDKVFHKLFKAGEEWANADEKARKMEKVKDSMLSEYKIKYIKAENGITNALAETKALADPEYKAFIEGMVIARGEANRARVKYEAAKDWFEALRTQASTLRQEMSMSNGNFNN